MVLPLLRGRTMRVVPRPITSLAFQLPDFIKLGSLPKRPPQRV